MDRATRRRLLDLLVKLPLIDTPQGRSRLLRDLPPSLVLNIERSSAVALDLDQIVVDCVGWMPARDTDAPPLLLLIENAADIVKGSQTEADLLAIKAALFSPPPSAVSDRPPCPYPGLHAFTADRASYFFGREQETGDLLRLVQARPLVLVVGPSGSGKSSLAFAGLVPALAREIPPWSVASLRPGPDPIFALTSTLGLDEVAADLNPSAFATAARRAILPNSYPLLLVLDQFEELFTQTRERAAQSAFLARLQALVAAGGCHLLLILRADFYGDLMDSPLWPVDMAAQAQVAPLRSDALAAAIVRPARQAGALIENVLVARLIEDAAHEPGSLPLLQETLVRLWAGMEERHLTLAAYAGLHPEPRGRLAAALARTAEETWVSLPRPHRALAHRVLLNLVQTDEDRLPTRRQRTIADLQAATDAAPEALAVTLDVLASSRLVTLSSSDPALTPNLPLADRTESALNSQSPIPRPPRADLAHEALISGWPRLASWIEERREGLALRRRLEGWVAEWGRRGQGASGLLDEGELLEAARWQTDHAADLGGIAGLDTLVGRSRAKLDADREREQAYIAALKRQTCQAQSLALAAYAENLISSNPVRAVLLAREAVCLSQQVSGSSPALVLSVLHRVLNEWPLLHTLCGHEDRVNSAAFSPDARWVVTASRDGTVRLWNAATGQEQTTLRGHEGEVNSAAFSPDGRTLITAGDDETARLWDAATGQEQITLHAHRWAVMDAAFSPDGHTIVTAGADGTVRLWNAATGLAQATLRGHLGVVNSATFSPEGHIIVTASRDGTVRLWDATTSQEQAILRGHAGRVMGAAFSPDGRTLVTASWDGTARLWDAATGQEQAILRSHVGEVTSAAFSPEGHIIVTASQDGTVRLWDAVAGQEQATLRGHVGRVMRAAFSPDGRTIVTAGEDGTARLWDAATGQEQATLRGHEDWVRSAVFSPDGHTIVTAGDDGTVRLWDAATSQEQATLRGHEHGVTSAAFSPDARWVVTASRDGTARLWDVTTGQEQTILRGHEDWVTCAVFSPDGCRVVTASRDGTARLWDVATGQEQAILHGHEHGVTGAAFSPDAHWALTASVDGTARLWDAATGQEQTILRGHAAWVSSVGFSPDGRTLVTTSGDGTARLWDMATGQERATLRGHKGQVMGAAFSPDGRIVVTAGEDGTARQYLVDADDLLWLAAARAGREMTGEEHTLYIGEPLPPPSSAPAAPRSGGASPGG